MQVKEHNTPWVKTQCSLAEPRKPALTRVGPSWHRTGLHSRACLLPSRFLVPLLPHSRVLSLAHSPSSQTGAAPSSKGWSHSRAEWGLVAGGRGTPGRKVAPRRVELHSGRAGGNRASCPAVGMGQSSASKALRTTWHCFSSPLGLWF